MSWSRTVSAVAWNAGPPSPTRLNAWRASVVVSWWTTPFWSPATETSASASSAVFQAASSPSGQASSACLPGACGDEREGGKEGRKGDGRQPAVSRVGSRRPTGRDGPRSRAPPDGDMTGGHSRGTSLHGASQRQGVSPGAQGPASGEAQGRAHRSGFASSRAAAGRPAGRAGRRRSSRRRCCAGAGGRASSCRSPSLLGTVGCWVGLELGVGVCAGWAEEGRVAVGRDGQKEGEGGQAARARAQQLTTAVPSARTHMVQRPSVDPHPPSRVPRTDSDALPRRATAPLVSVRGDVEARVALSSSTCACDAGLPSGRHGTVTERANRAHACLISLSR